MHVVEGLGGNWVWALLAKAQTRYVSSVALAGMAGLTLQHCTASAGWTGWTVGGLVGECMVCVRQVGSFGLFLSLSLLLPLSLSVPQPYVGVPIEYRVSQAPSSVRIRCNRSDHGYCLGTLLHCTVLVNDYWNDAKKELVISIPSYLCKYKCINYTFKDSRGKRKDEREMAKGTQYCIVLTVLYYKDPGTVPKVSHAAKTCKQTLCQDPYPA